MRFTQGQEVEYIGGVPKEMDGKRGVVEKYHPNGGEDFEQYDIRFRDEELGLKLIHHTNLRDVGELDEPLAAWEKELLEQSRQPTRDEIIDRAAELLLVRVFGL